MEYIRSQALDKKDRCVCLVLPHTSQVGRRRLTIPAPLSPRPRLFPAGECTSLTLLNFRNLVSGFWRDSIRGECDPFQLTKINKNLTKQYRQSKWEGPVWEKWVHSPPGKKKTILPTNVWEYKYKIWVDPVWEKWGPLPTREIAAVSLGNP